MVPFAELLCPVHGFMEIVAELGDMQVREQPINSYAELGDVHVRREGETVWCRAVCGCVWLYVAVCGCMV